MTTVLGYKRYAARGGDLGAGVISQLAIAHPESVIGIHVGGRCRGLILSICLKTCPMQKKNSWPTQKVDERRDGLRNASRFKTSDACLCTQ